MDQELNKFSQYETTTSRTLRNIKNTLKNSLNENYNIENDEIIEEILKVHGIHKDNFDFVANTEKIINEKLNDISIDDNSNKNEKTIEGIQQEIINPLKKVIGYDYLYRVLKEIYGQKEAKRLSGKMYDYSLALADSTNTLKVYCYAFDFSKLVTIGRDFGMLKSTPAKRITSYTSALSETIHQLSHHLAGAVAISTYFLDLCHLLLLKENIKLNKLKSKKIYKYIENEMQQLVHSVNFLSRDASQSPFTNISILCKYKIEKLIDDYSWYFDNFKKYKKSYIINYIMKLQKIFLNFFDKGDPTNNGLPYRFPVITLCFSKSLNIGTKEFEIDDKDFLKYSTKLDIYRYNIFVSEGDKFSSCCRLISDKEMLDLGSQSNSFGAGGSVSLGSHRVLTVNLNRIALESNSLLDFFRILDERLEDSTKILKAHKLLLQNLNDKDLQLFLKNGWISFKRLFSTWGLLGYYESIENLKSKFNLNKDIDILAYILKFINKKSKKLSKKYDLIINIEAIPGESMAVRLCSIDKLLYGENKVNYQLYSNQFVPLWEKMNIFDKFKIDGKYNQLITGGGIVHHTISNKVTSNQAEKVINYAVSVGCEHFALNAIYSVCEDNHFNFGKITKCSICGKNINNYFTRIVGYFVPVNSFNKIRREWEFPRRIIDDLRE